MSKTSDTTAELLDILARHASREAVTAYPPSEALLESLGISSAEMINVIIEIEDTFGGEVDETQILRYRTIADLVGAIEAARLERAG